MIHTILGAGGSVGNALTDELLKNGQNIRIVSRSGYSVKGAETVKGDVTSYKDTLESIKGSDVVYLCIGLPYDRKIWSERWPKIIQNTIDACKKENAKLLFLDNVYSYGKVDVNMTESTSYNPCSVKGEIRDKIALLLEREMKEGNIQTIIARAADWYGPYAADSSLPYKFMFDKLMRGKKAQWLIDADKLHSYSYTIDCAKGLYLLSMSNDAFNQVWHLPTFNPPLSGKEFIELATKELNVSSEYSILKKWMIRMVGFFNKTVYEAYEMLYQSEFDYWFDSTKFNSAFNYKPTPYDEGIRETIDFLKHSRIFKIHDSG